MGLAILECCLDISVAPWGPNDEVTGINDSVLELHSCPGHDWHVYEEFQLACRKAFGECYCNLHFATLIK
jgi:hypothetical protein